MYNVSSQRNWTKGTIVLFLGKISEPSTGGRSSDWQYKTVATDWHCHRYRSYSKRRRYRHQASAIACKGKNTIIDGNLNGIKSRYKWQIYKGCIHAIDIYDNPLDIRAIAHIRPQRPWIGQFSLTSRVNWGRMESLHPWPCGLW